MTHLLDTNVISELRRPGQMAAGVRRWLEHFDLQMAYLSAVTVFELEYGAARAELRRLPHAPLLRAWIDSQVLPAFAGRILPLDSDIAQRYAWLQASNPRPYADVMIAATALVHGLTVVTRNIDDFAPHGVSILNPWNQPS